MHGGEGKLSMSECVGEDGQHDGGTGRRGSS
jgi:hypothetical protein